MNSINASQRLSAITLAISITFSIVWGLSNYAYGEPAGAGAAQLVSKPAAAKACS